MNEDGVWRFAPCVSAPTPVGTPTDGPTPLRPPSRHSSMTQQSVHVRNAAKYLSRLRLGWCPEAWPQSFMLVHKCGLTAMPLLRELVEWLLEGSPVGTNSTLWMHSSLGEQVEDLKGGMERIKYWDSVGMGNVLSEVELVITLGGDGTMLEAAWLFQGIVPPIVPFHYGTVGFLNVFPAIEYYQDSPNHKRPREHANPHFTSPTRVLDRVIRNGCRVTIRMRLSCTLYRSGETGEEVQSFHVLNEVVVDRGAGPHMAMLDVLVEGILMTTVRADGLIVATPTGSTAYSLSAGGSVAHPEVPAILLTPICPHTLSFRPLILPDSVELVVRVSEGSRGDAWAAFDGKTRIRLGRGDRIVISSSNYPVPTVCRDDQTRDWVAGLGHCLRWNDPPSAEHLFVLPQGDGDVL